MLRLTTNVTVSPASSHAARPRHAHLLDRLRACLGEHGGQLLGAQRQAVAALLDRAAHKLGADRRGRVGATGATSRDEAPVLELDRVEHALGDPLGVDVLRVHAQPLGEREAVGLQALAHLVGRGERVLWGDVVAVGRQAAEVGGAGRHQLAPPVGEVRRDLDAHIRHQSARLGDQQLHVLDRHRAGALRCAHFGSGEPWAARGASPSRVHATRRPRSRHRAVLLVPTPVASTRARPRRRSRPAPARSSSGGARSSAGSPPGCGRTRRALGQRLQRGDALLGGLADATRMPLVNGICSSPAARIVSRRRAGCLVGEPACTVCIKRSDTDSSISPCEAVTSRRRPRSSRESTPRFVCGSSPRSSARSQVHTTYAVKSSCPYSLRRSRTCWVDLGVLAGEDQQLLDLPLGRTVEDLRDLLRRVQVCLVGRERAVLAVALARARQRDVRLREKVTRRRIWLSL